MRAKWLTERCWLAQFTNRPCDGAPIWRVHLIAKQSIERKGGDPWDERSYVRACGGSTGLEGHHGQFDTYRLVVPREALPVAVEELAEELNMGYYLERRYGPRPT